MSFSRKVFIALFLSIAVVGTAFIWCTYRYASKQTHEAFVSRYTVFSKVLGDTLTRLDKNTEALMLNAAQVVNAYDSQKGILSDNQLKKIRDSLNVTHIFIVDKNGKFIRSTNEDAELIPNAFSFCPAYKNMILGTSAMDATPIIHPQPEPKPYKFLFIPNSTRQRLLEVGVRIDFVARTLTEALGSDPNILSMSVYDPNGVSFGQFNSKEYNFTEKKVDLPVTMPAAIEDKNDFHFFTKIASSHPICCQCEVTHSSKNGEYYYIMESVVSKKELTAVLAKTKWMFILFGLAIMGVSLLFAQILVSRLTKNLKLAADRVRQIDFGTAGNDRINLGGTDEVSVLTGRVDTLLNDLEKSQKKLVESEKLQAKIQLASEVAHNIKSPLTAIEMMLPLIGISPDKVLKSLKISIKEIKHLAQSLKNHADNLSGNPSQENELIFLPIFLQEFVSQKMFEYSERKGLSVRYVTHCDDQNVFVKLKSSELRSILSNLVNNAADSYANHSGEIILELDSRLRFCIVRVIDCGAGIPKEYIDHLGSKRITFKGGNDRGIGLVHGFKLVESWGGSISIKSEVGSGTTVEVLLPKYNSGQDSSSAQIIDLGS